MTRNDKITVAEIRRKKKAGEKIVALTAYDYFTAKLLDRAGIDLVLVGDSLGMVVLGYETTVPVTMEDMLHHTRAVVRGNNRALVVADMPFLSCRISEEEAIRNAGRFLQEAGADAVKLEGGEEIAPLVERMTSAGIPVLGHIGLTPQSVLQLGGYRVKGKQAREATRLKKDAVALEQAGAFALVLEAIPAELGSDVSMSLAIPTIGIGAGPGCDGQVLVVHDLLGIGDGRPPKFVKAYADLAGEMLQAFSSFRDEVRSGSFPDADHSY